MTLSTSNSELVWSRRGISRLLKSITPFAALFVACNLVMPLWARSVGEKYVDCNNSLQGANILYKKDLLQRGVYPLRYDIIFAGTSRMMGDVSASAVAEKLGAALNTGGKIKAYNMGYIGRNVTQFERNLSGDATPKLLVFEFHPLLLMNDLSPKTEPGMYEDYRVASEVLELKLAGRLKQLFDLQNTVKIGPLSFKGFIQTYLKRKKSPKDLYYYHLDQSGYCQISEPDGQASYRHFLSDESQGKHVRIWNSAALEHSPLMGRSIDPKAWSAFERLVKRLGPSGRMAVVRLPFDLEGYALENKYEADIISKTKNLLKQYNVPYIDMNPNMRYFTSDTSHIDWYDTKALSEELAGRLLKDVRWNDIYARKDGRRRDRFRNN